ncbi:hypothetical protein M0802_006438 [Mischocyttarus mexicanus]|nr:hypothetical protein M0802_006438 [Mischocyttarus mexicanus]
MVKEVDVVEKGVEEGVLGGEDVEEGVTQYESWWCDDGLVMVVVVVVVVGVDVGVGFADGDADGDGGGDNSGKKRRNILEEPRVYI